MSGPAASMRLTARRLASLAGLLWVLGAAAPPALAANCAITLEVGDTQSFRQQDIVIGTDCQVFTVTLRHTGDMPVNAMGHNWVLTREADMMAVVRDGVGAGMANGFLVPGDPRVIAYSRLVGADEVTTLSFGTRELVPGETYAFFCSFPGHAHSMQGRLRRAD